MIGELEEKEKQHGKALINVDALAMQAGSTISGALAAGIVQGQDMNDVFKNIIESLAQMVLKALLFRAIMLAIGGGAAGGGGEGGLFGFSEGAVA